MDREKVKRRTAAGQREGKERKNRKTVQIYVKVDGVEGVSDGRVNDRQSK